VPYDPTIYLGSAAHYRDGRPAYTPELEAILTHKTALGGNRYLVGAASWLVASVLHARVGSRGSQQVVLDAGMTEFIRPALHGSRRSAHALRAKAPVGQAGRGRWTATGLLDTDLEGPVCGSTDSFGRHVLPPLDRGDLVAIEQAGAYGASFTSRYNGRPPAGVLLWLDGSLQPCERPPITPSLSLRRAYLTARRGWPGRGLATPWVPPRSRRSPCHEHLKPA